MGSKPRDPEIIVWMEIRAPEQPDEWNDYFQPMIQAPGHAESSWAKMPERLDTVLIATLWYSTSAMNEFRDSPSAQLFWESLNAKGITFLSSYESIYRGNWFGSLCMSYIQLFWVYFQAPVTEEQRAHISSVDGITAPALGPSVPRKEYVQRRLPTQVWITQTEHLHGTQVELMMWPHFWANAKKAEFRHSGTWGNKTLTDKFVARLKGLDPIEWREEFYRFKKIPYLKT